MFIPYCKKSVYNNLNHYSSFLNYDSCEVLTRIHRISSVVNARCRPWRSELSFVSENCFQEAANKNETKQCCATKININTYLCLIKEFSEISCPKILHMFSHQGCKNCKYYVPLTVLSWQP